MRYSSCWLTGGALAVFAVGIAWAQGNTKTAKPPEMTLEALKAEVEALKPEKLAWSQIAWKNCPLEALKDAREKNRPVLTWVFLGNPTDERC